LRRCRRRRRRYCGLGVPGWRESLWSSAYRRYLGTGESYDFNTLVEMLNDELGTDIEPEYIENPIPDSVYVYDTCADYSKMKAETGWEP